MATKYLTINFTKQHEYKWTGLLNNEEVKNKTKVLSTLSCEIESFSKELLFNEFMLGQITVMMPRYIVKINHLEFVKTNNLKIIVIKDKLTIEGSIIAKVQLKDEALIELTENLKNIYISNVSIWLPESPLNKNAYNYSVFGNWKKDNEYQETILKKGVDISSFNIVISDKKPKT